MTTLIPLWTLAFPTLAALIGLAAFIWIDRMLRDARGSSDYWREQTRLAFDRQKSAYAELDKIKIQRSLATSRGNRTRSAKRKALQDAMTAQLEDVSHG